MKGVVCVICPSCGAKVDSGFSFCVKCGSRLDAAQEPDYGKADMGGYHSEEEFPEGRGGFTMSTGTFVINDRPSSGSASDIYSADELNDSDEVFDFSMYDSSPEEGSSESKGREPAPSPAPAQQYNRYAASSGQYAAKGIKQSEFQDSQYQRSYGQSQQQYGQSQQPYGQNQQPYGQNPQYPGAQPFPGAVQPQVIGYDQNGMPVYSQPQMMYGQPQFIGYDQNGMPIYSQGMPANAAMQQYKPAQPPQQEEQPEEKESSEADFWAFFDEGKETKHSGEADDFFGRKQDVPVQISEYARRKRRAATT